MVARPMEERGYDFSHYVNLKMLLPWLNPWVEKPNWGIKTVQECCYISPFVKITHFAGIR